MWTLIFIFLRFEEFIVSVVLCCQFENKYSHFFKYCLFLLYFCSSRSRVSCALDIFIMLFGSFQYSLFFLLCTSLYINIYYGQLILSSDMSSDLWIPSVAFFSSIKLIFIYFLHFFFIIISSLKSFQRILFSSQRLIKSSSPYTKNKIIGSSVSVFTGASIFPICLVLP